MAYPWMRVLGSAVMVLALLVAEPGLANGAGPQSTVITFDINRFADDAAVPQNLGDIPNRVDVQYGGVNASGKRLTNDLKLWGGDQFAGMKRVAVARLDGADEFGEVALIPWPGQKVSLQSFKIGGWGKRNDVRLRIWEDRVGLKLEKTLNLDGPTTISPALESTHGLRIQFQAMSGYVAIDDISFSVTEAAVVKGKAFPPDAVIDLTRPPYNAKGDGVTDNTQAFRTAIHDWQGRQRGTAHTLYLPDGTYLVSDQIAWRALDTGAPGYDDQYSKGWRGMLAVQGQSRQGTIIKLKDRSPGFENPDRPRHVLVTASDLGDAEHGGGRQAFGNSLFDLTVDTGEGNPGACGIRFNASGWGSLRHVTIRSGDSNKVGVRGIDLFAGDNGPGLIRDVEVSGFSTGVHAAGPTQFTLSNVTLRNQKSVGILASGITLAIENLVTENIDGPVIKQDLEPSLINVIGGKFNGGPAGTTAIFVAHPQSEAYLRNITTTGYARVANIRGTEVPGTFIKESISNQVQSLNRSAARSLNLPIKPTPEFWEPDLSKWQAIDGTYDDDTADVQAAFEAATARGATVVYFPNSVTGFPGYQIHATIEVPASIRMIYGCNSAVSLHTPGPAFRFSGGTAEQSTVIDHFDQVLSKVDGPGFEHADARTLIFRNGQFGLIRNSPKAEGELFLEDVRAELNLPTPHKTWARQLNTEDSTVLNQGGSLWILGHKTERNATVFETLGGGKTEVLGSVLRAQVPVDPAHPALINVDSSLAASFNLVGKDENCPLVMVRERRGFGAAKELGRDVLNVTSTGRTCVLYSSYSSTGR